MSFKKTEHCVFVEEETYNWAPAKSAISTRSVIVLTLLMAIIALFVSIAT